ncbi:MAG: diacylglycerol/lipid kinase family protein [Candidatus Zixiibacteriota bacterium]
MTGERTERARSSRAPGTRRSGFRGRSARPYSPRKKRLITLENPESSLFRGSVIDDFVRKLNERGYDVERVRPSGPKAMATEASRAIKKKPYAMIAVGGDGAVNLVARALVGSPVRLAILPQGRFNNIFNSLVGAPSSARALEAITSEKVQALDCGKVSGQPFFGSIGLGLAPALQRALASRALPRFSIGWSRAITRALAETDRSRTPVKVDSYRFDIDSLLINVNLLSYSAGLQLAPSALADDHKFEVTLDMGVEGTPVAKVVRDIFRKKYHFDNGIRLYRGEEITIGAVKGRTLYLDGELIKVPTNTLEVTFYSKRLKLCVPGAFGVTAGAESPRGRR